MRGWLILAGAIILAIVLPFFARFGWFGPWGSIGFVIGQIVLSIVLVLAIVGTGLFGYICIRAQARKWGAGLIVAAVLCLLVIFWVWTDKLLLFV